MTDQYKEYGFKYAGSKRRYYGPKQEGLRIKKFSLYQPTNISYSDQTIDLQGEKGKGLISHS